MTRARYLEAKNRDRERGKALTAESATNEAFDILNARVTEAESNNLIGETEKNLSQQPKSVRPLWKRILRLG